MTEWQFNGLLACLTAVSVLAAVVIGCYFVVRCLFYPRPRLFIGGVHWGPSHQWEMPDGRVGVQCECMPWVAVGWFAANGWTRESLNAVPLEVLADLAEQFGMHSVAIGLRSSEIYRKSFTDNIRTEGQVADRLREHKETVAPLMADDRFRWMPLGKNWWGAQ
jgi:hypothetical protein